MSVVALNVPEVALNTTVAPPVVMLLLLEFRACTVITWVLVPSAVLVAVAGLIVEVAALAGAVNVTVAVWVI